jgi:hypothetical protein
VSNSAYCVHNFSITFIEHIRGLGVSEVGTVDWKSSQPGLAMHKHHNSQSLDLPHSVSDMLSEAMDNLDHGHNKVSTRIGPETADFVLVMAVMLVGILAVSVLA